MSLNEKFFNYTVIAFKVDFINLAYFINIQNKLYLNLIAQKSQIFEI